VKPTALVHPTPPRNGRGWAFASALALLIGASFWSLDLQWAQFFSLEAARSMGRFLGEFFPPDTSPEFLRRVLQGTWETLAMSALGTLLAAAAGLALALPASRLHAGDAAHGRGPVRLLLNALRSVPELVWAALLLIAAGLGPFAGTLALAIHTSGVLGRLFTEGGDRGVASIIWTLSSKELRGLDLCGGGTMGFLLLLPTTPLGVLLTGRPPNGGGDRGGSP